MSEDDPAPLLEERATAARLSALVAQFPGGVMLETPDRHIVEVNRAFCELFAIPVAPERLAGVDCAASAQQSKLLFADPEAFLAGIDRVLASRAAALGEELLLRDGRVFRRDYVPIDFGDGRLGHLWHYRDESERARSEAIVRARLRLVSEGEGRVPAEVLRIALDECEAVTGSAIGFFHFVGEDQRTIELQAWSTATRGTMCKTAPDAQHYPIGQAGVWADAVRQRRTVVHDDYASLPHRHGLPEGHAPLTRELVVPVLREGRVVALAGVGNKPGPYAAHDVEAVSQIAEAAWDVVARLRAAQELRETNDRLAQALAELERVRERVIQQERLSAVGQLAAGIAHDFNNLLAVIVAYSEVTRDAADVPAEHREDLDEIAGAAHRGAQLVRQLLDFGRRSVRQPITLDLVAPLDRTLHFMRRTISESIRLELDASPGEHRVVADELQLRQVIANLALNARDAMPEGGTFTLQLRNASVVGAVCACCGEPLDGPFEELSASDTGTGIAPDVLPHVFEPFFTTKTIGKGTGLGLAQVYGIVRQHGGHITVESALGVGTRFRMLFPAAASDAASDAEAAAPALSSPGARRTLLLVEDEPAVLRATALMLRRLGHHVCAVGSAAEAIATFRARRAEIELLITDAVMPGMSGLSLSAELRALEPKLPVLVLSGYPASDFAAAQSELRDLRWLQKPASLSELDRHVREALAGPT